MEFNKCSTNTQQCNCLNKKEGTDNESKQTKLSTYYTDLIKTWSVIQKLFRINFRSYRNSLETHKNFKQCSISLIFLPLAVFSYKYIKTIGKSHQVVKQKPNSRPFCLAEVLYQSLFLNSSSLLVLNSLTYRILAVLGF